MNTQKGIVVARIFLALVVSIFASSAFADMRAVLENEQSTARIQGDAADLIAYYTRRGEVMDLTMLFSDDDGEVLRSRIVLSDGQTHTILLGTDETLRATRYTFQRVGKMVGIKVIAEPGPKLALSQ